MIQRGRWLPATQLSTVMAKAVLRYKGNSSTVVPAVAVVQHEAV